MARGICENELGSHFHSSFHPFGSLISRACVSGLVTTKPQVKISMSVYPWAANACFSSAEREHITLIWKPSPEPWLPSARREA